MSVLSALLGTALRPLGRRQARAFHSPGETPSWVSVPLAQPGADPLLLTRFAAALSDWSRSPDAAAQDRLLGTISDRLQTQWSLLYPGDTLAPLRDLSRSLGASSRLVLSEAKGEALLLVLRLTCGGDWRPVACLRFRSQAGKIASIQLAAL